MNLDFSRLVYDAAQVGASGRWGAVNAALVRLAAKPGLDNVWYVELLGALCSKIFAEYLLLRNAFEEKKGDDASLLAWRARNFLELAVWSIYFSKGRENAHRLFEDAGRGGVMCGL